MTYQSYVILFQFCCFNFQGKMCNPSQKWKTFTVSWKNVFEYHSIGKHEHCEYRKGRLHCLVKVVGLFVCVCVGVLCVGAWMCDKKPDDHHRWNYGYIWIHIICSLLTIVTCCKTTVMSPKPTLHAAVWVNCYSKHLTVPFNCAAFSN